MSEKFESDDVTKTFNHKARIWSQKGQWAKPIGDDCPLDAMAAGCIKSGMTVIDVGGGNGKLLLKLSQQLGNGNAFLVDSSRSMVRAATSNFAPNSDKACLALVASGERIPLPSNFCDVAILRHLLQHVPNPKVVVRETWRVLQNGAVALIQVPGPGFLGEWLPYQGVHQNDSIGRFSRDEIATLLKEAGFSPQTSLHKFTYRFDNMFGIFKHFESIALLERLVGYHHGAPQSFGKLFRSPLIANMLTSIGPAPIEVNCDYVVGIAKK